MSKSYHHPPGCINLDTTLDCFLPCTSTSIHLQVLQNILQIHSHLPVSPDTTLAQATIISCLDHEKCILMSLPGATVAHPKSILKFQPSFYSSVLKLSMASQINPKCLTHKIWQCGYWPPHHNQPNSPLTGLSPGVLVFVLFLEYTKLFPSSWSLEDHHLSPECSFYSSSHDWSHNPSGLSLKVSFLEGLFLTILSKWYSRVSLS